MVCRFICSYLCSFIIIVILHCWDNDSLHIYMGVYHFQPFDPWLGRFADIVGLLGLV